MSKRKRASVPDAPEVRGRTRGDTKTDMSDQLWNIFGKDDDPNVVGLEETGRSSNRGFEKRPAKRPLDIEGSTWYKRGAEEHKSSASRFVNKRRSSDSAPEPAKSNRERKIEMPDSNKTEKNQSSEKANSQEEIFEKGREQGKAEERAKFADGATEKAAEAAKTFGAKVGALYSKFKAPVWATIGVVVGVSAKVAKDKWDDSRDQGRMQIGDTTVMWDANNPQPQGGGDGGNMGGGNQGGQGGNQGGGRGGRGR